MTLDERLQLAFPNGAPADVAAFLRGEWVSNMQGLSLSVKARAEEARREAVQMHADAFYKLRGVAGGMIGREGLGDLARLPYPDWFRDRKEKEQAEAAMAAEERARQMGEVNRLADERNRRQAEEIERRTQERLAVIDDITTRELLDVVFDNNPPLALTQAFAWGNLTSADRLALANALTRVGFDPVKSKAARRLQLLGNTMSAGAL